MNGRSAGQARRALGKAAIRACVGISLLIAIGCALPRAARADSVQDRLIAGTGAFLQNRFDSEMQQMLLMLLARNLCVEETKGYFPSFCAFRETMARQVFPSYSGLVAALREDVRLLPIHLVEIHADRAGIAKSDTFLIFEAVAEGARSDQDLLGYLATLSTDPETMLQCGHNTVKRACGLLAIGALSTALVEYQRKSRQRAAADRGYGIDEITADFCRVLGATLEDLDGSVHRLTGVPIALLETKSVGLVSGEVKSLCALAADPVTGEPRLKAPIDETQELTYLVRFALHHRESIGSRIGSDFKPAKRALAVLLYARLFLDTLKSGQIVPKIGTPTAIVDGQQLDQIAGQLKALTELAALISDELYPEALVSLTKYLDARCKDLPNGQCEAGVSKETKILEKYLPFVFELEAARTAEDVTSAIETVASPVGAWRLKRDAGMASITAFIGWQGGYEMPNEGPNSGVTGAFAPLGVDISIPCSKGKSASGLLVSFFDFGNLISFRVGGEDRHDASGTDSNGDKADKDVENRSDYTLEQVLAPGMFLHYGFSNSPLVIGFGASYTPALRKVTIGDQEKNTGVVRYALFLAMDITIFPLGSW